LTDVITSQATAFSLPIVPTLSVVLALTLTLPESKLQIFAMLFAINILNFERLGF